MALGIVFAVLVAVCWSWGGFASSRIAKALGSLRANCWRLWLASLVLALVYVVIMGFPLPEAGIPWILAGGVAHLAIGDLGLYACYRRLGPRLGVLLCGTGSTICAGLVEWIWRGQALSALQIALALGILAAVVVALAPTERARYTPAVLIGGLIAGFVAAVGQGLGAVVTRIGIQEMAALAEQQGKEAAPLEVVAMLRVAAGATGVLAFLLAVQAWRRLRGRAIYDPPPPTTGAAPRMRYHGPRTIPVWMGVSVLLGPILGMICLMQALSRAPSGLVQAAVATLPVWMIPVAWLMDGDRPSLRSALAGAVAVGLVIALVLVG